jgi:hypothetical protein
MPHVKYKIIKSAKIYRASLTNVMNVLEQWQDNGELYIDVLVAAMGGRNENANF